MNEIKTEPSEPILEKKRIYWLDHARGFIMILLVVTMYLPDWIREGPLRFFLEHPEHSTTTHIMNFYDIGAPAFIIIMGLLMPFSFTKRKQSDGVNKAVFHILIRYGIIFGLGLLTVLIDQGSFIKKVDGEPLIVSGMPVIYWDVLPTLGLVGIIALPFLWVSPKLRAVLATILIIFYQFMLIYGGWREYAIASVHGGILGTIFAFSAIMIYSTSIGEYLLVEKNSDYAVKFRNLAIIGIITLVGGLLIMLLPECYPNKRQVSASYCYISLGVSILMAFIFIALDKKYRKPIFFLDSYGKSPFLIYIVAIVLKFLIEDIIGLEITLLIGLTMIVLISVMVIVLDLKGKIIKL
ncbi:MAG: heparan-alpha-glucosaminide N-acetyltransferase domain-containing protein [Promethearchaeota archaeon]